MARNLPPVDVALPLSGNPLKIIHRPANRNPTDSNQLDQPDHRETGREIDEPRVRRKSFSIAMVINPPRVKLLFLDNVYYVDSPIKNYLQREQFDSSVSKPYSKTHD